jgi:hypothetical protein
MFDSSPCPITSTTKFDSRQIVDDLKVIEAITQGTQGLVKLCSKLRHPSAQELTDAPQANPQDWGRSYGRPHPMGSTPPQGQKRNSSSRPRTESRLRSSSHNNPTGLNGPMSAHLASSATTFGDSPGQSVSPLGASFTVSRGSKTSSNSRGWRSMFGWSA